MVTMPRSKLPDSWSSNRVPRRGGDAERGRVGERERDATRKGGRERESRDEERERGGGVRIRSDRVRIRSDIWSGETASSLLPSKRDPLPVTSRWCPLFGVLLGVASSSSWWAPDAPISPLSSLSIGSSPSPPSSRSLSRSRRRTCMSSRRSFRPQASRGLTTLDGAPRQRVARTRRARSRWRHPPLGSRT